MEISKSKRLALLLFLILFINVSLCHAPRNPIKSEYTIGQPLDIECKDSTGSWAKGPICTINNEPMIIKYGVDSLQHCTIPIQTEESFSYYSRIIEQQESWDCQVRISPMEDLFVPFSIPIWGFVEPNHLHIDNHLNFLFHGYEGKVLGGGAYPMRDQFQYVAVGGNINLHGTVKWFQKGTFASFQATTTDDNIAFKHILTTSLICSFITLIITTIVMVSIYQCYLLPSMLKQFQKLKKN